MIKYYILILLLALSIPSFSQQLLFEDFQLYENCPIWARVLSFQHDSLIMVTRDMNPFYLEADFNGEGKPDIVLSIKNKETGKRGTLIIHAESSQSFQIGAGDKFDSVGDDFNWLDVWSVYREKTAEKTLFNENMDIDGGETIELKNIAIQVSESEQSSNLIMWDGSKYIWIHTGE